MGMMGAATAEGSRVFDWAVSKRLLAYLAPYKSNVRRALGAVMLSVVASVLGPPLVGLAVDEGVRKGNLAFVVLGVAAYLLADGLGQVGFYIQITNMAFAGQRVIQRLRDELFGHIQHLSMSFFSTYETGRLIARVIGDVNVLREAITFAVVGTVRDLITLFVVLVAMLLINLPLTLITLLVVATIIVMANFWRIYARKAYIRVRETNSAVNAELSEAFNAVRVTQAFARQGYNYQRFTGQINQAHRTSNLRAALVASLFFPGIELIGGVATGALIYFGGTLVLNESISVATLLTFVLYTDQLFFPIRLLAQRYNIFQAVMAAGDKIFRLMDAPYEIADAPDATPMPPINGHVRFDDVHFAYRTPESIDSERPAQAKNSNGGSNGHATNGDAEAALPGGELVLKGISLDIPAGSTVALVGHTGAGKSSIIKLLLRFYDVSEGRLLIDGIDVRTVQQKTLRAQMGVVLQETHLFSGTVMENIRYGRLSASDEEVMTAAEAVGAGDFIRRLENGYQTEVREGGAILSAGQKQLIAFARALLADPRILILDEATSSIDTQTEKVIQEALRRLLRGRTSFVIAHRLSTITAADLIVVMDHGQVVESGSHAELLARGGVYRDLYTMAYARPLQSLN
jgi:ATP-binding cassette subfamily B protein/subfamily B ATP-binding cassette protein MsbA